MSLTVTNLISGSRRSYNLQHGLRIMHARITTTAITDYVVGGATNGFDIPSLRLQLGFNAIFAVLGAQVKSGTTEKLFVGFYDYDTGKLRFARTGTAVSLPLEEIAQSDLTANDVIDCIIVGIG